MYKVNPHEFFIAVHCSSSIIAKTFTRHLREMSSSRRCINALVTQDFTVLFSAAVLLSVHPIIYFFTQFVAKFLPLKYA